MGGNQKSLRTYSNGTAALGFGKDNKIGTMDLTGGSAEHPWYPQAFMGSGSTQTTTRPGTSLKPASSGPALRGLGEPTRAGPTLLLDPPTT